MKKYYKYAKYSYERYDYIKRVIESCYTIDQLISTQTMIQNYLSICEKFYKDLKSFSNIIYSIGYYKYAKRYMEMVNEQISEFKSMIEYQQGYINEANAKKIVKINGFS